MIGRVAKVDVDAVVASTHALEKYGGRFRLTREDLEDMFERYQAGDVNMNIGHDPLHPGGAEVLSAKVEATGDGEWRLVVTFSVEEQVWNAFSSEAEARGVTTPAMSYSRTISFAEVGVGQPVMLVAADAAIYSQSDILDAAEELPHDVPALAAEYVEFGLIDETVNVLIVWQQHPEVQDLEWATVSALLLPVLQRLHRAGRRIRYRIQVRRANATQVDVVAEIDDSEEQLRHFAERIADLEQRVDDLESELWEWKNGSWWRRLTGK